MPPGTRWRQRVRQSPAQQFAVQPVDHHAQIGTRPRRQPDQDFLERVTRPDHVAARAVRPTGWGGTWVNLRRSVWRRSHRRSDQGRPRRATCVPEQGCRTASPLPVACPVRRDGAGTHGGQRRRSRSGTGQEVAGSAGIRIRRLPNWCWLYSSGVQEPPRPAPTATAPKRLSGVPGRPRRPSCS